MVGLSVAIHCFVPVRLGAVVCRDGLAGHSHVCHSIGRARRSGGLARWIRAVHGPGVAKGCCAVVWCSEVLWRGGLARPSIVTHRYGRVVPRLVAVRLCWAAFSNGRAQRSQVLQRYGLACSRAVAVWDRKALFGFGGVQDSWVVAVSGRVECWLRAVRFSPVAQWLRLEPRRYVGV